VLSALLAAGVVVLVAAGARGALSEPARRRARSRVATRPPSRPPARLAAAVAAADLPVAAERAWLGWLVAVTLAALAGLVLGGAGAALVLAAVAGVAPAGVLHALRHRAAERAMRQVPAALELVARSLRSGAVLRDALADAAATTPGRLGDDLRAVCAEVAAGRPLVDALDGWAARLPRPAVRLAVAALSLGAEAGGATARALDGVAATLRANEAVAAEARALASQARLSALVIAVAPVAFLLLAAGADPRTLDFLLRTPVGLACLAAGLALDGLAAVWMHRVTDRVVTA
jgi:tight adherence protein B